MIVRFMTRSGCSLCDKARAVLVREGIVFEVVDIDRDPALKAEYGSFVPVVERDGEWLFEAGMDPEDLPELLRQ